MDTFGQAIETQRGESDGHARRTRPLLSATRRPVRPCSDGALRRAAGFAARALGETLYATRCVICDAPGADLCERCRLRLPYIDRYLACTRCGAPNGHLQCTECNTLALAELGRAELPYEGCASVIEHRGHARSIVTAYKDSGQRQLARLMAQLLSRIIPARWKAPGTVLAFVPADEKARRRRGFDHMELIASELAPLVGIPRVQVLRKAAVADQRNLGRVERFGNIAGTIRVSPGLSSPVPTRIILIDDVYTTGATLFAACDALRAAGARQIRCATFARVP